MSQHYTATFSRREWSMHQVLRCALKTSALHDQCIRKQIKTDILSPSQTWIITQYQLFQHATLVNDEPIEVATTIVQLNRYFVTREFVVYQNHQKCLTIHTQYAVLNWQTRQMEKLGDITLLTPFVMKQALLFDKVPNEFGKLVSDVEQRIEAKDIDENQHVNNLTYIDWSLEVLANEGVIDKMHVKYGSELRKSDQVSIVTYRQGQRTHQQIMNKTLDKVACYVTISWKQQEEERTH